jgi:hypothetical protein
MSSKVATELAAGTRRRLFLFLLIVLLLRSLLLSVTTSGKAHECSSCGRSSPSRVSPLSCPLRTHRLAAGRKYVRPTVAMTICRLLRPWNASARSAAWTYVAPSRTQNHCPSQQTAQSAARTGLSQNRQNSTRSRARRAACRSPSGSSREPPARRREIPAAATWRHRAENLVSSSACVRRRAPGGGRVQSVPWRPGSDRQSSAAPRGSPPRAQTAPRAVGFVGTSPGC